MSGHGVKRSGGASYSCTTLGGVAVSVGIAVVVSLRHMHELCLRHGEDHLAAVLIPPAVDSTIVVVSMSILLANRYGRRGGALARTLPLRNPPPDLT
ncbi:DUF2637 domain-containing protein [Spongiactinospora sp. 9N601]|uniref:DUF2637 domain-containing protein n=1 Tax=Spongiactinospora sp. 9N601 TaxID=3375149 RepID=UPI0037AA71B2